MSLLVTGGCGFIGSQVVRMLLERTQERVINLDKRTYAAVATEPSASRERYRLVQADIREGRTLAEVFRTERPRAVLHLAAESHVDRSIDGPEAFIQTNLVGTFRLLEQARAYWQALSGSEREAFRFIHVSTDEVYGSLGLEADACGEASSYAPRSPYAATKAGADHLVRAWGETYGLPVIVTNSTNNYGPGQFPEKLIPLCLIRALRGESIPVYGRGENVRDWLYVGDHAEALRTVLARGRPGQTYHLGADNEHSNLAVVKALCAELDELAPSENGPYEQHLRFVKDRPGHDLRYALDASKARRELGWEPRMGWAHGLRATVRWYLDNRSWWEGILARTDACARRGQVEGASE